MKKKKCFGCGGKAEMGKMFESDTIYFCIKCFKELYPTDSEWFLYG